MGGYNPYVVKDDVDDNVNVEDFLNVGDQDRHFLKYLLFYGIVDNQAKPILQPPTSHCKESEGNMDFMEHFIQYLHNEVNRICKDVTNARHDTNRHKEEI
jgi:hypothetical protein